MEYKVKPLLMQQVNWEPYIDTYMELFGDSPTRELDKRGMKLDHQMAFPNSLEHCFDGNISRHLVFSFICTANADMLIEIQNRTNIKILSKESTEERGVYIFIATASIDEWREGLKAVAECSKHLNNFCHVVQTFLRMAGYTV